MPGPVIAARFDPTKTYLASAVQALDTHQIKVQALVVAQDSLNTSLSLSKGQKVSALEWISPSEIAICLTKGTVLVYTPSSNSITAEFQCPSNASITDFHNSPISNTAWVSDADGNLYEWSLQSHTLLSAFALADMIDAVEKVSRLTTILYQNELHLLVGTHSVHLINVQTRSIVKSFSAHVQSINSITPVANDPDLFMTSAEGDRFINVYSISKSSTKAVLVASSSVTSVELGISGDISIVTAITETGTLEVFKDPLSFEAPPQESSKKRRKQLASSVKSKHADASIKYSRPEDEIRNPDDELLEINAITITESILYTTWMENGSIARFDAVPWHTQSGFAFSGSIVLRKSKDDVQVAQHTEAGHDVAAPRLYNEGNTVVTEGGAFQDDLINDKDDETETLAERLEKLSGGSERRSALGKKKLRRHTAGTLMVVLSQALRNNDHSLLETVLANRDPQIVQNTISRLDASLAVVLLDKLAERITRQQQRFEQLNFWLKWIIIIHGGVLSSMPNLRNKLSSLNAILSKKASSLPRLLELQGRMDMIEQQRGLKREILSGAYRQNDYDDADTDVEYVEELDDAVESGMIESDDDDDIDMNAVDDYEEDESELDEENGVAGKSFGDEDGLSDVETGVVNTDVHEED